VRVLLPEVPAHVRAQRRLLAEPGEGPRPLEPGFERATPRSSQSPGGHLITFRKPLLCQFHRPSSGAEWREQSGSARGSSSLKRRRISSSREVGTGRPPGLCPLNIRPSASAQRARTAASCLTMCDRMRTLTTARLAGVALRSLFARSSAESKSFLYMREHQRVAKS